MRELARHYTKFRVAERTLLTGHSHQAWPDCAFVGQQQAWHDAAEFVDGKWERAFEMATRVSQGFAGMLEDSSGEYALAANTHDLVVRFLSALPLKQRPRLVTTDSEFHSLRRQLQRLGEEGVEVVVVPAHPVDGLIERVRAATTDRTAAVLLSAVFFNSGQRAPDLAPVLERCQAVGAELLIDVYHALNVAPFTVKGLEQAFIVGGGYKYCQMGEGNCFLRYPRGCTLRPVITGWMADYGSLHHAPQPHALVGYGESTRFAGATSDPTSHYRAVSVFEFFQREGLTPATLRATSQRQMKLLVDGFDALSLSEARITRDRTVPLERLAGFLSLRSSRAFEISAALKERGVFTDSRGDLLRLGPAPYVSDEQLTAALHTLKEIVNSGPQSSS